MSMCDKLFSFGNVRMASYIDMLCFCDARISSLFVTLKRDVMTFPQTLESHPAARFTPRCQSLVVSAQAELHAED